MMTHELKTLALVVLTTLALLMGDQLWRMVSSDLSAAGAFLGVAVGVCAGVALAVAVFVNPKE
jgi:hypothetical protein